MKCNAMGCVRGRVTLSVSVVDCLDCGGSGERAMHYVTVTLADPIEPVESPTDHYYRLISSYGIDAVSRAYAQGSANLDEAEADLAAGAFKTERERHDYRDGATCTDDQGDMWTRIDGSWVRNIPVAFGTTQ